MSKCAGFAFAAPPQPSAVTAILGEQKETEPLEWISLNDRPLRRAKFRYTGTHNPSECSSSQIAKSAAVIYDQLREPDSVHGVI